MATYSFLDVTVSVDGYQITGFADGNDAVKVEQSTEASTMTIGAGGSRIHNQTGDRSAMLTLKLQHTSPGHAYLVNKWKAQRNGRGVEFGVNVTEGVSGEGGSGVGCFIGKAPDDQKGMEAEAREWVINIGDWTPEIKGGSV